MFRSLGRYFLKGTRWEAKAFQFYMAAVDSFNYRKLPHSPYTVNPPFDLESFKIYLPPSHKSPSHEEKINGKYEKEILKNLVSRATESTHFWEIGGGWGYFSLALADTVEEVTTFEVDPERVNKIKKSARKNGFDNLEVLQTKVGHGNSLDNYPVPDLILMDIEGWEYEALKSSPELLQQRPTLIIELHDTETLYMAEPDVRPHDTINLLEENGFSVSELYSREEGNFHIIAKPPCLN